MQENNIFNLDNEEQNNNRNMSPEEYRQFLEFQRFKQYKSQSSQHGMAYNNSNQQYTNQNIKPKKKTSVGKIILYVIGFLFMVGMISSFQSALPKNIPDVTGQSSYRATSILKDTLGNAITINEKYEYSDTIEKGDIIRTEPQAGSTFNRTPITLYISSGKERIMPDIIGMNIDAAKEILSELEVSIDVIEQYDNSEVGTIINTDCVAGTDLNKEHHSCIRVTVSKGSMESFTENAQEISYDELYRYPETYKDTALKMNVTITKIDDSKIFGVSYSTAYWATYNGETIILYDEREVKEPNVKVNDKITVYGYGNGTSTIDVRQKEYQGSLLIGFSYDKTVDSYEVPCIKIEHIELR